METAIQLTKSKSFKRIIDAVVLITEIVQFSLLAIIFLYLMYGAAWFLVPESWISFIPGVKL